MHLWPHRVKFYCRLLSISCLIQISIQSVFSMSYAFVLGGNPCGCYVCLCVGCWLSSEITKQTCCFKLIEKLPEELTLPFPLSHPPATTPSPSSPSLSPPSAPRCGCFQPQTPSLTQHLISPHSPSHQCFIPLLCILSTLVFLLLLPLHWNPTSPPPPPSAGLNGDNSVVIISGYESGPVI